jgi:hypothetical protein
MEMNPADGREKKKNRRKFLIWLLSLLLIVTLAGGIWYYFHSKPVAIVSGVFPDAQNAQKMTDKEMKNFANKAVDKSKVTLKVYPEVNIKSDSINGHMWVKNVPVNEAGQQAILKDATTGKELFKSGLIKPGYEIVNAKLNEKLSPGKHKGSVIIEFYDLKSKKLLGKTSVSVVINVDK